MNNLSNFFCVLFLYIRTGTLKTPPQTKHLPSECLQNHPKKETHGTLNLLKHVKIHWKSNKTCNRKTKKDPIQRTRYMFQTGLVLSKNSQNPKPISKIFSGHTFNPNWWSSCSHCSQSIFNLNKLSRRTKKEDARQSFPLSGKIFRGCHDFLLKLHLYVWLPKAFKTLMSTAERNQQNTAVLFDWQAYKVNGTRHQ